MSDFPKIQNLILILNFRVLYLLELLFLRVNI